MRERMSLAFLPRGSVVSQSSPVVWTKLPMGRYYPVENCDGHFTLFFLTFYSQKNKMRGSISHFLLVAALANFHLRSKHYQKITS